MLRQNCARLIRNWVLFVVGKINCFCTGLAVYFWTFFKVVCGSNGIEYKFDFCCEISLWSYATGGITISKPACRTCAGRA